MSEVRKITLMRDLDIGDYFSVNGTLYQKTNSEKADAKTGPYTNFSVGVPASWTVKRVQTTETK